MQQLERTTVQLWEARRLAKYNDVPHGRLALLLLDNAAEIVLRRSSSAMMYSVDLHEGLLRQLDGIETAEAQELRAELEPKTLTKKERRAIDREFNALVDFVFGDEACSMDADLASCLKILHRYRNAAYHRDLVNTDVLSSAIQIYFYLCCKLLKNQRFWIDQIDAAPPAILEIFGEHPPRGSWPTGAFSSRELGNLVADWFLVEMKVDHVQIAAVLSDHLAARIDALEKNLDEIADYFPPLARPQALRLVQLAPKDPEEAAQGAPADFWTRPLPVTTDVLDGWKAEALKIRKMSTAHSALVAFADIESHVAGIEEPTEALIEQIDREVQMEIDLRRGK
ncbi:hypothetical protein ACSNOI_30020 [Actinomadura kijaniata]|uniref:hypothetical protein n=1 Tax=Actinomadura kijaniata TaxID=46161 RepID=UPI003F1D288F